MAKSSDHTYELLLIGGGIVAAYLIAKRRQAPALAYDTFGNPISLGPYGAGPPAGGYASPYGSPYTTDNTAPNIINAVANLFNSTANAGILQPSLPLGQAGVTNPPPFY